MSSALRIVQPSQVTPEPVGATAPGTRGHGRLRAGALRSNAGLLACFVCDDAELASDRRARVALARHTLAWLDNPARRMLTLRLTTPAPRGWWIEGTRIGPDDDQAD